MIKKLYIKDFRNIKELTIEPSQFINLISGNNGEGKSSILYAIEYLLTDNLNEKISEYVRWGCEKFFLEMEFVINNDNYLIKVECGKTAKKDLNINGELNYKNSEATKKLAEIINPNIIRYSSISEQGKTAQILFDTPANRLKKLKEILGIDKIADLCDELKQDIDKKQEEIKLYDKEIKTLEERTYNFMEVPEIKDISKLQSDFNLLQKDKELYELQNKIYTLYLQDKNKYNEAQQKILELNFEIEQNTLKINQKKLEIIKDVNSESIDNLQVQLIEIEKKKIERENLNKEYKRLKIENEQIEKDIEDRKQGLDKLPLRRLGICDFNNEDVIHYENQVSENKIYLNTYEKELQLIKEGKCPTCGKDYIGDENILIKKIEECKSFISLYTEKVKEIKKSINDYNAQVQEQEIVKVKRISIQKAIDELYEKWSVIHKQLEGNKFDLVIGDQEDFNSIIDRLNNQIKLFKLNEDRNKSIEKEIIYLQSKIESNNNLIQQYNEIKEPEQVEEPIQYDEELYDTLNKEIIVHEQKVKQKEGIEIFNKQVEDEKTYNQERIKSLTSLIDTLSYEVSILKESRQVLDKDFSAWLIDQGAEYIKDKMNQFFSTAYGRYEITFSQEKNSIDFFYGDGDSVAPCSMASGMERAVLAIAFRVALSSLNNLGLMILDEIDSDGSNERSMQLYEALLENVGSHQLFVITHCEETKEWLLQQNGSKEFNVVNGKIN